MFSLRDEARADYVGTLRKVVGAGYSAIEAAFGYGGLEAAELRRVLDDLGVRVIACHVGSDRFRAALDEEIEYNLAIGNRDVLCAELPIEDRIDEGAFHRWAAELNGIGRRCRELGAQLSYHSHSFEFRRFGEGTIDPAPAIAAGTSLEWLIVEQEFAERPMLESLAISREYLRARGYENPPKEAR